MQLSKLLSLKELSLLEAIFLDDINNQLYYKLQAEDNRL